MKRPIDNTKNYTIERDQNRDNYVIQPLKPYSDMRLSLAEFGFLMKLLNLPNEWKITQRATANHFNISTKSFNTYIKRLIEIGYIEIQKTNWNKTTYLIKETPIKADFDIKNIENYTIKQLNTFLNDSRVEKRYKNLIKKALKHAEKTNEDFKKILEELEEQTKTENPTEEQTKDYELPF